MNNELQVFSYKGDKPVRIVEVDGESGFVAKDVCDILEIVDSTTATRDLDDDEKDTHSMRTPGGMQNMTVISEPGVYALIMKSRKPEAKQFSRWVRHEVLPSIRKTGTYGLTSAQITHEENELRKRELDVRCAEILQRILYNPPFPVTPETQTVFAHEVFKLTTGHSYLAMLPDCTEKWYTATEIGNELGISANKVGRIAKANGIKAPEGEAPKR